MRAFAQKPKATQQAKFAKSSYPAQVASVQSQGVNSILDLQRTIGNHAVQRLLQSNAEELHAQSATPASTRFVHDFGRIPILSPSRVPVQPRLTISTPGDIYEQEADRVAEQLTRMPEPQLQRACPCGGGCPKCQTQHLQPAHERVEAKRVEASDPG